MNARLEFHYRVPWRASGLHPGHHHSRQSGDGFDFHGHAGLLDAPDPRRLDVRASLRDPFGQLRFRVYRQRSAIPVYALADLSASMGFAGRVRKLTLLADFVAALSYSAYRTGDPFGFFGCDTVIRNEWVQPLTLVKSAGHELARRLREYRPEGKGIDGLLLASELLGRQRGLVFLLSDFHFPLTRLDRLMATLTRHTVVPVVFWDRTEYADLPGFGFAQVGDPETGAKRSLLLRPALRDRIRKAFAQRHTVLRDCLLSWNSPPLLLGDDFDPDQVTRYFYT